MFSDPQRNLEQFELLPEMKVADFGSGSGFYSLEAAKLVGDKGRVYCVDIQKDLLAKIKNAAAKERLFNIEVIWGDIEKLGGTRLKDFSIDAVIVSNLLFQIKEKATLVNEIRRILKPKGKVLVVDWSDSFGGLGPTQASVVTKDNAIALFKKTGFTLNKEIFAGDHHYGLIFSIELETINNLNAKYN